MIAYESDGLSEPKFELSVKNISLVSWGVLRSSFGAPSSSVGNVFLVTLVLLILFLSDLFVFDLLLFSGTHGTAYQHTSQTGALVCCPS